jgi:WD40 repeat protein
MQLVTSAADGLVKLWNIKDEECVKTLDNHEDKVSAATSEHGFSLMTRSGQSQYQAMKRQSYPRVPIPSLPSGKIRLKPSKMKRTTR